MSDSDVIRLACLGCEIELRCSDEATADWLAGNFAAMAAGAGRPDLAYRIARAPSGAYHVSRPARETPPLPVLDATPRDLGALVYALEADLVVAFQLLRPELLFLHAAALERDGDAHLLVGHSGAGKSTTCWGLLHHGFRYLSDELAPIDLSTGTVGAYSHALCMKREPPDSYPAPEDALRSERGVHIPIGGDRLCPPAPRPSLRSILIVEYDPTAGSPRLSDVGQAEAAARIFPQILNALAHDNDGLAAAAELVRRVPVRMLRAAELAATCRSVEEALR